MPATSVTATTTAEVQLQPAVKKKLLLALRTYVGLKDEQKALDAAKDKVKATVGDILEDVGESSLKVNGFTTTWVGGTRRVLNRETFARLGGDLAMLDAAYEDKSNKPYVKISVPGDTEDA